MDLEWEPRAMTNDLDAGRALQMQDVDVFGPCVSHGP